MFFVKIYDDGVTCPSRVSSSTWRSPLSGENKECWFSQRGMGLIEALIVIGIVGIVSLGVASLLGSIMMGQAAQKYLTQVNNLHEEIRTELSKPQACLNTFRTISLVDNASFPLMGIKDASASPGAGAYIVGQTYGDRTLKIGSVQ